MILNLLSIDQTIKYCSERNDQSATAQLIGFNRDLIDLQFNDTTVATLELLHISLYGLDTLRIGYICNADLRIFLTEFIQLTFERNSVLLLFPILCLDFLYN